MSFDNKRDGWKRLRSLVAVRWKSLSALPLVHRLRSLVCGEGWCPPLFERLKNWHLPKRLHSLVLVRWEKCLKCVFGGNASLTVFILVLIFVFLLKEGWHFFPSHHQHLQLYRKSGQEYFAWVEEAYQQYQVSAEALNRAYQAEVAYPNRENQNRKAAYQATRRFAEKELGHSLLILRDAVKQRSLTESRPMDNERATKLDGVIESLKTSINEQRPSLREKIETRKILGISFPGVRVAELKGVDEEEREKMIAAIVALNFWEEDESSYYKQIEEESAAAARAASENTRPLLAAYQTFANGIAKPLEEIWKEAAEYSRSTRKRVDSNETVPREIAGQIKEALDSDEPLVRQTKYGELLELIANAEYFDEYARIFYLFRVTEALFALKPDGAAYDALPEKTRQKVEGIFNGVSGNYAEFVEVLRTGGDELDAFPKAVPADTMDPDMRYQLFALTRVERGTDQLIRQLAIEAGNFVHAFPFDKEARKIYDLTDRFNAALREIKENGLRELEKLPNPESMQTLEARNEITRYGNTFKKDIQELEALGKKLEAWKFDKPWKWRETFGAFFFGKKWTTHSQDKFALPSARPQDEQHFYGITPMVTSSLVISLIALAFAVPFAVAAAVYVNQMASFKEQNLVKPAMEFIGAIPSVVLGFLGIVVLGEMIQTLSGWAIFSWLPGFPIEARFNRFTAGLLIAFLAIPIIFTLTEDALNKVPATYRDGALSLGASHLQTAFRVVLPAALSGVLAAILLGFGRVIGETMVVLLVAGNRIEMPDSARGLGALTEPGQAMSGMIASGLESAARDSVEYRALFMVGLVLFLITLLINFLGQKILTKFKVYG